MDFMKRKNRKIIGTENVAMEKLRKGKRQKRVNNEEVLILINESRC
jgi:hypothetical protein